MSGDSQTFGQPKFCFLDSWAQVLCLLRQLLLQALDLKKFQHHHHPGCYFISYPKLLKNHEFKLSSGKPCHRLKNPPKKDVLAENTYHLSNFLKPFGNAGFPISNQLCFFAGYVGKSEIHSMVIQSFMFRVQFQIPDHQIVIPLSTKMEPYQTFLGHTSFILAKIWKKILAPPISGYHAASRLLPYPSPLWRLHLDALGTICRAKKKTAPNHLPKKTAERNLVAKLHDGCVLFLSTARFMIVFWSSSSSIVVFMAFRGIIKTRTNPVKSGSPAFSLLENYVWRPQGLVTSNQPKQFTRQRRLESGFPPRSPFSRSSDFSGNFSAQHPSKRAETAQPSGSWYHAGLAFGTKPHIRVPHFRIFRWV